MIKLIDRVADSDAFALAFGPLVIAFPLALIVMFIALHRAGAAPRWAILFPIAALVVAVTEPFSTQASTAVALGLMAVAAVGVASRAFGSGVPAPTPS